MKELEQRPIGKYIDQLNGFAFKSELFNQDDSGIRLCRGINITRGKLRFDSSNEMFWNDESIDLKKYLLDQGDIVISMDGSLVGRNFAIVQNDDLPLLLVQRVARLRAKEELSQGFLYQWIASDHFVKYVDSVKTSSGIPHISAAQINEFKITFLPYQEQQKIASILTKWDETIEIQTQLIEAKEKQKKGLMQKLLTGEVRFPGFEEEWEEVEIQEIGNVIRGASPRPQGDPKYYGGNVPRLMGKDVTRDGKYVTPSVDFLTVEGAQKSRPCKKGTLTIVCSGDVGVPSILAVDACIHDGFLAIIDLDEKRIDTEFLYYQMFRLSSLIERSATHGGVFTNLTTTILKEFIISIPNLKEQLKITSILTDMDTEIQLQKNNLENLQRQKKGLMQELLTGRIRVKA